MIKHYSNLDAHLAVGSHPHAPEHITSLARDHGVTSVVCLQTDDDLSSRGLHWSILWQLYLATGLDVTRVPIVDFDKGDLLVCLDAAVEAIHGGMASDGKVYVHCTAGLNRSPTAVIAYLMKHRGLSLDDAQDWVKERHECVPYPDVLEAWAQRAS